NLTTLKPWNDLGSNVRKKLVDADVKFKTFLNFLNLKQTDPIELSHFNLLKLTPLHQIFLNFLIKFSHMMSNVRLYVLGNATKQAKIVSKRLTMSVRVQG